MHWKNLFGSLCVLVTKLEIYLANQGKTVSKYSLSKIYPYLLKFYNFDR